MSATLLLVSLIAGVLTVLAPCIVVLLPVILGTSSTADDPKQKWRVIGSLSASILLFSILLKATTVLIAVPTAVWSAISGAIIILVGFSYLFPQLWLSTANALGLESFSAKVSSAGLKSTSNWRDYLIGASLGPVFSACSPTYALVVAVILPTSPLEGVIYLLAFIGGLAAMLLAIAYGGQRLLTKLNFAFDANGKFRKWLGVIFILIGVMIAFGVDKEFETFLIERGLFDWQVELENSIQS